MKSAIEIFNSILEDILPTSQEMEKTHRITEEIKQSLISRAKKLNIEYTKIEAQGSTGIKNTQLKGDFDIDLFIGLDYENYEQAYKGLSKNKLKKQLKSLFLDYCKKWLIKSLVKESFSNPQLLYAEHPYVTVYYFTEKDPIKVDLVLYFDLALEYIDKHGPITAVDRSPWHGRFIRDNLSAAQKKRCSTFKAIFQSSS